MTTRRWPRSAPTATAASSPTRAPRSTRWPRPSARASTSRPSRTKSTRGGLVVTLAGRVPAEGDEIEGPGGHRLTVRAADPRRVIEVGIAAGPEREAGESDRPGDAADAA
ncbi:transporter associated domain-containing protein [Chenggangzhangella methanolivorans]|uniref:transporter associated domain-containing protein n=1 Tax=Chenggangzhangella methanolivorans TaxID=1437009 RepID=UPI0021BD021B|nr:transporter associated domain-containing protein [Chenggangzhangella methanolivorans]